MIMMKLYEEKFLFVGMSEWKDDLRKFNLSSKQIYGKLDKKINN